MMMEMVLDIFLMFAYIIFWCYIGYRIMIFLMDKMIALIYKSKWFRVFVGFFGSIIFAIFSLIELRDYYSGKETGEVLFIAVVSLMLSLYFLYYTFVAYKDKRGAIDFE